MGDHHDHIHVGWRPLYGTNSKMAKQVNAILKPKQWIKLIDRLGEIDNPTVRRKPSKYAVPRASRPRTPTRASSLAALPRFGFVQWEFPGRVGPDPGRYVVRRYAGDDVRQVLVIGGFDAPRRLRRRARRADPGPHQRRAHARDGDRRDAARRARGGRRLARSARPATTASASPGRRSSCSTARSPASASRAPTRGCPTPTSTHALVCRVGYGTGEQVADGEWESAVELPLPAPPSARIADPLAAGAPGRPAQRPRRGAGLRGADPAAPAATSTTAARARRRSQLAIALDTALAELEAWREQGDMARRLKELDDRREAVARAARAALAGGVDHRADGRRHVRRSSGSRPRCARGRSCRSEPGRTSRL